MISKNVTPVVSYNGDNAATVFAITYPTFEIESLRVYVTLLLDGTETNLVNGVDYTPANIGAPGVDAQITLINSGQAWINGGGGGLDVQYSIHVDFDSDAFQPGSFRALGNYSPITLEKTLDRLTMSLKAIKNTVDGFSGAQTDQNTQDIADIQATLVIMQAEIDAVEADLAALEMLYLSKDQAILDSVINTDLASATINHASHEHMVFEYVIVRNGQVQYGREIVVYNGGFTMAPIEKSGDVGVTFNVIEAVGVGTVRYTSTATTFAGTIWYKLYKFDIV